jgi:serine/threonine protein kinase/tetratricopeptide (TPR) repeat protein
MTERELFEAALEVPPEDRAAHLDRVCGTDAALRQRLEDLLRKHDQAKSFLEAPPAEFARTVNGPAIEETGTQIGPYKLLEQIGEGGMGVVFMADQHAPVRRRVALKIIKPGMDSRTVLARFDAERQALALMDHPNIARAIDAGVTDSGRPFFVMELVRGVPITDYCDQKNLAVHERLALFVDVCRAVQHAHQKGVIHRDIKPSNILVTLFDGRAVPKVIDFGVAKAIHQPLTHQTLFTRFAEMIGTPLYMSPEQAEMTALDIDTRSDIYSLGVLLYELLTGTTPFDKNRLKQAAYDEIRRIIREEEAAKPSTRISSLGEKSGVVAAQRHADPRGLSQLVQGDLDWIVMKALEKERSRRYETASGFAMDIERHLADEPVLACPPSTTYRLRKFVRRNRRQVIAAALVFFSLLGGMAGTTIGLVRTAQQRALAEENEKKATEAANAERHAKEEAARQRVLALRERDIARQSVEDMYTGVAEKWLRYQPRLQKVQEDFLKKALAYYEGCAQQESDEPEAQHRRGIAYKRVGDMQAKLGKHAEAKKAYRNAIHVLAPLAAQAKDVPEYAADLGRTHYMAGLLFERVGQPLEAERAYREALSCQEPLARGPASPPERKKDLALTWRDLGELLTEVGRPKESDEAYRRALKIQQAADFPTLPEYRNDLAMTLYKLGDFLETRADSNGEPLPLPEAQALFREALTINDRLEADFPAVPAYRENVGMLANSLACLLAGSVGSERDKLWHRALAVQQRLVADFPDIPEYRWELATTQCNLGFLQYISDQYKESEAAHKQALPIMEKLVADLPHVPQNQSLIAGVLNNLATSICRQNRPAEALPIQARALSYNRKALESYPANPMFRDQAWKCYINLAQCHSLLGDHVAAAQAVQEGVRTLARVEVYSRAATIMVRCVTLAEKDVKLTEVQRRSNAQEYKLEAIAFYRQALELAKQQAANSKDPARFSGPVQRYLDLVKALRVLGKSVQAKEVLREAIDFLTKATEGDGVGQANSFSDLGVCSVWLGCWDQALAAIDKAAELDPANHWYPFRAAPLHLRAGDVAGYRRVCRAMLERFRGTQVLEIAERTAKTCLLAPDAVPDLDRVQKLADRTVTGTENRWFLFVKGLAEYRAGQYAEAVKWLDRFGPDAHGTHIDATAFAVLAMAQQRLGQKEKARTALHSGQAIVAEKMPNPAAVGPFQGMWQDWLHSQILLREAEALLKPQQQKKDKPAK